jgi:hypothetical protein
VLRKNGGACAREKTNLKSSISMHIGGLLLAVAVRKNLVTVDALNVHCWYRASVALHVFKMRSGPCCPKTAEVAREARTVRMTNNV